jgi:hypothetical protein
VAGLNGPAAPTLSVQLFRADGAAIELPLGDAPLSTAAPAALEGSADGFDLHARFVPVREGCAFLDCELRIAHRGPATEVGVRVTLDLRGSARSFQIPALFYGENRLPDCRRIYPRWDASGGEADELVSDSWSFRADRAALPAVFGWNDSLSAALCTDEESGLGLTGVGFAGTADATRIWLDFPYREEPVTFTGHPPPLPPDRAFHSWAPGEEHSLRLQVYVAEPDLHAYDRFLRAMYRRRTDADAIAPWMTPARAAELTADALVRFHYKADHAALFETIGFDRENTCEATDRPAMHVAWVSGAPYAHALLTYGRRTGRQHYVDAAASVLDKIASGLTPGGTFWGEWRVDKGWRAGWNANPRWVHARTLAEATLFMTRAIAFDRDRGAEHPGWERAVRSNLDVAVQRQDEAGNFGAYYDTDTGEVVEWRSAAGILWIAALVEGAAAFADERYLAAARKAGRYYRRFVDEQFIYGAPEDVHLAPTSEDGYNAVMAYVLLYEADRDAAWLDLASRAADWMLTFRWTYNVRFSERTILGRYDFRTRGGDQASTAIQIIHPYGLICLPEMARLARHTGDDYYRDRTRDNLACFLQFVAREDGDFGAYRGMVTERYYQTNAFQAKGMLLPLSHAWCVGVTLYACQEVEAYPEIVGAVTDVVSEPETRSAPQDGREEVHARSA